MGLGPHSSGREEVKETGRLLCGEAHSVWKQRRGAAPVRRLGLRRDAATRAVEEPTPQNSSKSISSRFSVRVRVAGAGQCPL